MENITKDTILYKIENKITEAKEDKIKLLANDKNHPNLPSLNDRITSLTLIKSELIKVNHANVYHLTEEEEITELNKMVKARVKNIKAYSDNGRPELAEADYKEMQVIKEFIPNAIDEEELKTFINQKIDEFLAAQADGYALSMKDMGKIKPLVNATYPTANGGFIKDVLMSRING